MGFTKIYFQTFLYFLGFSMTYSENQINVRILCSAGMGWIIKKNIFNDLITFLLKKTWSRQTTLLKLLQPSFYTVWTFVLANVKYLEKLL